MKLDDQYRALRTPASGGVNTFMAEVIPGWDRFRIARDAAGRPALLVCPLDHSSPDVRLATELKHVSFAPAVGCEIEDGGGISTALLSVVRCRSEMPELQRIFLSTAASWIETVGQDPTTSSLSSAFQRVAQLFESLALPASRSMKGLWGELLVIAGAEDPALLVRAWHAVSTELFDFKAGLQVVEVKTTSSVPRRHEVALDQLAPSAGTSAVLVSIVVDETDPRASVWDLAEVAKARLDEPDLRLRVDEVILATLGQDWVHARQLGFNVPRALASYRAYPSDRIPRVAADLPPEVSDVRFKVELDGVRPLSYNELRERSGLHAAITLTDPFS